MTGSDIPKKTAEALLRTLEDVKPCDWAKNETGKGYIIQFREYEATVRIYRGLLFDNCAIIIYNKDEAPGKQYVGEITGRRAKRLYCHIERGIRKQQQDEEMRERNEALQKLADFCQVQESDIQGKSGGGPDVQCEISGGGVRAEAL